MPHQHLGQRGPVASQKRGHHLLVFGHGPAPVLGCIVADKPDALHPPLQKRVHLDQCGIARGRHNHAVDLLVQLVVGQPLARAVVDEHLLVHGFDPGDLRVRGRGAGPEPGHAFQFRDHVQHVAHLVGGEGPHHGAAPGPEHDQPFASQGADRLAHRGAGHTQFRAEPGFVHRIAGREPPFDDHVPDAARDQLVQRLA